MTRRAATAARPGMALWGLDFSSAPSRRKPITRACGVREGRRVVLDRIDAWPDFGGFEAALVEPGPWLAACDFPFGLPRELVETLDWPRAWPALIRHYAGLSRAQIRDTFKAFCDARPVGGKFAHRACDRPAGSSPSMKWVNPPVAFMLHAGAPRLLEAGVHLPGLHDGDRRRVALEAYPGMLARELIGTRSYKSDEVRRQTPQRTQARTDLVAALEAGRSRLGLELVLNAAQRESLCADGMADRLDAVLCLLQAAWASGLPGHGLPSPIDPIEGWIVSA